MSEPSTNNNGIIDAKLYTDGSGKKYLYQPAGGSRIPATIESVIGKQHFICMEGQAVFKVAVEKMADVAGEMMLRNNLISKILHYTE